MKFFRRLFLSSNFWPLIIILFFALLAGRYLLQPGYFNMHDDLQMMRQLEMEKCFKDLQIPCRWVPDMGYGFGFPLFNYYPPLPYLIGQVFRLIGFSFVDTVKIVFLLSFIVSGITMYFLAKEFFGVEGGVLSAIFYIWAPYHSVDIFVRGAMNEAWALSWFPLILWTAYNLIHKTKNRNNWSIGLALSWFALFLTHNLMVLIFTPVFAVWCLLFFWKEKAWRLIPKFIIAALLNLGLAAFFTIPAILEQKYVQVNTLVVGYYEYIAHFASLRQLLFSRFWGYGPSVWLELDKMSFQVGHLHWILTLVIGGLIIWKLIKKGKKSILHTPYPIPLFLFLIGWFSLFMTHSRSNFLWKIITPLKFVQFPWRFLTITTLIFSFLIGSLTLFLPKKISYWLIGLLAIGLLIFNWNYFRPEKMGPLTDTQKFTGAAWELQQTAGIYDYLPKSAITAPKEPQKKLAEVMDGAAIIKNEKQGTNWASFNVVVASPSAVVRVGIFNFPKWRAYIDSKETKVFIGKDEQWGRMYLTIPQGEHKVYIRLYNTPLRTTANIISLITWAGLIYYLFRKKHK
jgi:hypothetical protein